MIDRSIVSDNVCVCFVCFNDDDGLLYEFNYQNKKESLRTQQESLADNAPIGKNDFFVFCLVQSEPRQLAVFLS